MPPAAPTLTFTDEPLHRIVAALQTQQARHPHETLEFLVLDPDLGQGCAAGERLEHHGAAYRHRPFGSWCDLAERLSCRFLTPIREGELIRLRFLPLQDTADASQALSLEDTDPAEGYGATSPFSRVRKLEEPCFLLDYSEALTRTQPPVGGAVLDLGVNTGDEFARFSTLFGAAYASSLSFTGVDHSKSALDHAQARFPGDTFTFLEADIGALGELSLGRFDLVISIATLQSPGVDGKETMRQLVQNHLTPIGGLILGFPNCRYRGGEVVYGAKLKNFRRPDLSLLVKDVMFYKKYLQQHRFQVFLTGKYYLFLTAFRRG